MNQPNSESTQSNQSISKLLSQPKSTTGYWLGRWKKWQQSRLKAKQKLTKT